MKFTKNLKHILIITIITFFVVMIMNELLSQDIHNSSKNSFIRSVDSPFLNSLYKHPQKASTDIVVIPIDAKMMSEFQGGRDFGMSNGTFTIPKSYYKDWIQTLEDAGAKVIGIDIIFQNRDDFESDFADFLKKYDNIVLASQVGSNCIKDEVSSSSGVMNCNGMPRSLYNGTTLGYVGADSDGQVLEPYVRNIRTDIFSGAIFETFSIALYRKYIGDTGSTLKIPDSSQNSYRAGNLDIPLNSKGKILNTYFGVPQEYYVDSNYRNTGGANKNRGETKVGVFGYSYNKAIMKKLFGGKIVLIGESGELLHDLVISPIVSSKDGENIQMAGVELHANMLDGLLQNSLLRDMDFTVTIILILGIIVLLVFLSVEFNSILSGVFTLITLIFLVFLGRYLYGHERILVNIIIFLFAGGFPWIITYIYKFFVIDQEKRFLRQAFAHYIDPTVVADIADNASDIVLGGENRDLSVLFSDIAGFTTISEKLPPKELFNLMSSYLSQMTDILIQNGGTLDKYIGDAVMGFFGAPIHEEDHALRSCRTAVAMRAALPGFNAELIKNGKDPIDFRVGIASGEVMVGNIGSRDRFNYTVLGDPVNLASRLEATSKEYGTRVIISESTYLAVKDYFFIRKLDLIAVKGKHEGVGIYELISDIDDTTIDRKKYERYELALALYFQGKYEEAGKAFEANMQDDPPSSTMMMRCADLIKGVVKLENGVFVMTHK